MGIRRQAEVSFIRNAERVRTVHVPTTLGRLIPPSYASPWKSPLAIFPDKGLHCAMQSSGLKRHTDNPITVHNALRAELEQMRDRGYALEETAVLRGPEIPVKMPTTPALAGSIVKLAVGLSAALGHRA